MMGGREERRERKKGSREEGNVRQTETMAKEKN